MQRGGLQPDAAELQPVSYDLPMLEYRPYRAVDTRQRSLLMLQLFAGIDVPYGRSVVSPLGAPTPGLKNAQSIGLRMISTGGAIPDGRRQEGSSKAAARAEADRSPASHRRPSDGSGDPTVATRTQSATRGHGTPRPLCRHRGVQSAGRGDGR